MKKLIKIGVTDLSFHRVTASLITHVLESMDFQVERIYAPHHENFLNLKAGKVDLLTSAWLPSSHGIYKAETESVEPLIELGLHYEPYAMWGVPDYVPESMVTEIADLTQPDVVKRMNKTIQGINPGAGITRFSIEMMEKYGLSDVGYQFYPGTEEDCFQAYEKAVENKEWVIVPLWKPQFLHHKYSIRQLEDPKGLLGIIDRAVLLLRENQSHLFTQEQLEKLDSLRFSNEIIAELDYQVCRKGADLDTVTAQWLLDKEMVIK